MVEHMLVNVGFNITNPLHDEIVNTSVEIRDKFGSKWFMDDVRYHLHFPAYLFAAPSGSEKEIAEISRAYIKLTKRLEIKSKDLISSKSGLVMITFDQNEELFKLHTEAVRLFNPVRKGLLRDKYKDPKYTSKYSAGDKEKIKKYGSVHVFENYEPHITIANIENSEICEKVVDKYKKRFINKVSSLDRLQVHTPIFAEGDDDKTVLLFDEKIK